MQAPALSITRTPTRDELIKRLILLPEVIESEERRVLHLVTQAENAREELKDAEAVLLASGQIDGKNEAIRAAQLRQATETERLRVEDAEQKADAAKIGLRRLQNELSALRSIARLLGGVE